MTEEAYIEPDTKLWTWVLERRCDECGFDAATVDVRSIADEVRRVAAAWTGRLGHQDVRVRPVPTVWSTLEYGCHVRDVFELFDRRLELMLTQDDPQFANWDQDATAIDADYRSQDPLVVSSELVTAGERLAARYETIGDDQWGRRGRRSDGEVFTVESFTRYLLHDPVHHLWDTRAHAADPV